MSRRRQAGFTLVELMVALLISALLVGMILAIFSRMSLAYRGQQQIAGVQQVLAAARATIELDAKQAGLGMAQGFTAVPTGSVIQSPVQVIDSSTGPDQIAIFYADPTLPAVVTGASTWPTSLDVDAATGFSPGDLIVLSTAETADATAIPSPFINPYTGIKEANITRYTACVMRISPASGSVVIGPPGHIAIDGAPPWGWGGAGNGPCAGSPAPSKTLVYKFVAHAYRIDTSTAARAALGPLQQSLTGGLLGNAEVWNDLAYGFTDLQTAERVVLNAINVANINPDGDGDVTRDWYSDATQAAMNTVPSAPPLNAIPMQMSISLVARTDRDVEGIATLATPNLIDPAHPNNNAIGNRASIALPSKPPWLADPALQGPRIYRYVTFQVDFRNLGVGL